MGLSLVSSVASGNGFTCARRDDGTVWCWGANGKGELGADPSTTESASPLPVPGIDNATAVFAGPRATGACATVGTGGTLVCWGMGKGGAKTQGLNAVVSATVGNGFACARTTQGKLWCWGQNAAGQCADGTLGGPEVPSPKLVSAAGVTSVGAGNDFACLLNEQQEVFCWGADTYGQLGNGLPKASEPTPQLVMGGAKGLSVGGFHACASDDSAFSCWGIALNAASPILIPGVAIPTAMSSVGSADGTDCGVFGPAEVRCWVANIVAPTTVAW